VLRVRPLLALLGLLAACDPPGDPRSAWLQTTLVLDNQVFLDTDPQQGQAKFARMSLGLYPYFRGTLGQYARDLGEGGGAGRLASEYVTAETADVALIGDPHLENIGSFHRGDGELVIGFNDFDAATYGPYHFDLRRLALGFHIAALELDLAEPTRHAEAAAAGYVAEIQALSAGAPRSATGDGEILQNLLKKAAEDGEARQELSDYTRIVAGEREMFFGEVEPSVAWEMAPHTMELATDQITPASATETLLLEQLLARWPATLGDPAVLAPDADRIKGIGRRLGAGVASYAAPRYYVLLEGSTPDQGDDLLLELKRVYDGAVMPGLSRLPGRPFADNGTRVVALQRELQPGSDCDPLLGHAELGGASFRVRDRSKFQRGLDLEKLAEKLADGDWTEDDIAVLADQAGRLLARAHAGARRQSGPIALPALAAAITRDPEGLVAETVAFVRDYAPIVEADYQRFLDVLAALGPSLGYPH
jgi:uncharacterized protein (DUF2252 family)